MVANRPRLKSWRFFAAASLMIAAMAWPAAAQTPPRTLQRSVTIDVQSDRHAGEFVVPVNKSQILRVDTPFTDLAVGNAAIADVLPLTNRSVYVLGKEIGSTNLLIYGANRNLLAVVDLNVTYDVEGLKAKLFEMLPNERVEVRAMNDSVVLSGTISSADQLSKIMAIAQRFAPEKVTNLMAVRGSQQVMLAVRFAEVARSVLKDVRSRLSIAYATANTALSLLTGDPVSPTTMAFGSILRATGNWALSAEFDALEEKGVVKTLAEPNLIALSGDTANFLAGGEFPIPVAQSGNVVGGTAAITIEFKEFGVSLAFTPTVIDDSRINLVVSPEVSQLDFSRVVTLSGTTIPSLTTRRASTTIELANGQSFAIAGLLQNNFNDNVRQFPWLGDIPILGALLRSTDFQRNETELVILVTPYIVKPTRPDAALLPTDRFVPPSEADLFLYGRIESPRSGLQRPGESAALRNAGGITGAHGHILK